MCSEIEGLFSYKDGHLYWNVSTGRVKAGQIAGSLCPDGYVRVKAKGLRLLAHHIVWWLHTNEWPDKLDHRDRNPSNNRIENLRPATLSQNQHNTGVPAHNSSGTKGLSRKRGKWYGQIKLGSKVYTKQSADCSAVKEWLTTKRQELVGEFAHG